MDDTTLLEAVEVLSAGDPLSDGEDPEEEQDLVANGSGDHSQTTIRRTVCIQGKL